MNRIVLLIEGPDAEQALAELVANVKYDNLNVAIWIADNPKIVAMGDSTLSFVQSFEDDKEEIKH